jgi:hypothetical protein
MAEENGATGATYSEVVRKAVNASLRPSFRVRAVEGSRTAFQDFRGAFTGVTSEPEQVVNFTNQDVPVTATGYIPSLISNQ